MFPLPTMCNREIENALYEIGINRVCSSDRALSFEQKGCEYYVFSQLFLWCIEAAGKEIIPAAWKTVQELILEFRKYFDDRRIKAENNMESREVYREWAREKV